MFLFSIEFLNIIAIGFPSCSYKSCRILGCKPSGPGDLLKTRIGISDLIMNKENGVETLTNSDKDKANTLSDFFAAHTNRVEFWDVSHLDQEIYLYSTRVTFSSPFLRL
jgi:hypothetical protein